MTTICETCQGLGEIEQEQQIGFVVEPWVECPDCLGKDQTAEPSRPARCFACGDLAIDTPEGRPGGFCQTHLDMVENT